MKVSWWLWGPKIWMQESTHVLPLMKQDPALPLCHCKLDVISAWETLSSVLISFFKVMSLGKLSLMEVLRRKPSYLQLVQLWLTLPPVWEWTFYRMLHYLVQREVCHHLRLLGRKLMVLSLMSVLGQGSQSCLLDHCLSEVSLYWEYRLYTWNSNFLGLIPFLSAGHCNEIYTNSFWKNVDSLLTIK